MLLLVLLTISEYLIKFTSAVNEEDWYSVKKIEGIEGWVDLRKSRSTKLEKLTAEYLAFVNESLSFQFPFYGEDFTDIKVTSQGFISVSEYVMSDTQYIGPLMANFRPYPNKQSTQDIRVLYNSDHAIIQWGNMLLSEQTSVGPFEFQLHLNISGAITMLYKSVPIPLQQIDDNNHKVTAGISGGHTMGRSVPIAYSTISISNITTNSTYILMPLATCLDQKNCSSCNSWSAMCRWCDAIQHCSSGEDRLKDTWLQNDCSARSTRDCDATGPTSLPPFSFTSSSSFYPTSHTPTAGVRTHPTHRTPTYSGQHTTPPHSANRTVKQTIIPDNTPTTEVADVTVSGPAQPVTLPVIYIILIVAFSLSFILVASAIVILLCHKRRLHLHSVTRTAQPESNNLLSSSPTDAHSVKC